MGDTLLNNNKFQKINVNATSLNKIFSEYGSPDCLKIDVEVMTLTFKIYGLIKYSTYLIIEIQNKTLYYLMENFCINISTLFWDIEYQKIIED